MEALFVGLPAVKVDEVTAAAVAEALRRADTVKAAAEALDRSRGFIYDTLRRRQTRMGQRRLGRLRSGAAPPPPAGWMVGRRAESPDQSI